MAYRPSATCNVAFSGDFDARSGRDPAAASDFGRFGPISRPRSLSGSRQPVANVAYGADFSRRHSDNPISKPTAASAKRNRTGRPSPGEGSNRTG